MKLTRTIYAPNETPVTVRWLMAMLEKGLRAGPVVLTLGRKTRTTEQNSKLWACLSDVSRQVEWYGQKLTPEEWKHVFTAALTRQKVVPGIDGGFVVLGKSTSKMSKSEFSELIELIYIFGAERGVEWSEKEDCIEAVRMNANVDDIINARPGMRR